MDSLLFFCIHYKIKRENFYDSIRVTYPKCSSQGVTLDIRTPSWTELYLAMFKKGDSMYVHRSGGDGLDPKEIEI